MKRKIRTPEERRADRERFEARQAELHGHIERIKAELGVERQQELEYYIERAKAELEAKRNSA